MGATAGATLEFFNVTNRTTAPIAVSGAITAAGPITVNISSGVFVAGNTYPLISRGSGTPSPVVNPPTVSGTAGILFTNGNTIVLSIPAAPYTWTGGASGSWDATTTGDWQQGGLGVVWRE